jgi:hypothetical protein|tara:strand:- start:156 stop:569 length:414 start_codon:yes stop_codon:yes gene_type:complete
MTRFINLIVKNGGSSGEGGFVADPSMDGDNLINDSFISLVKPVTIAGLSANEIQILVSFLDAGGSSGDIAKYTLKVSKAQSGDPDGASNKPSAEWMAAAKKAISAAISNDSPGGRRTTVSLPKDGTEQVYFRSITLN